MLFQKKIDRALALLKEKRGLLDKKSGEDNSNTSADDENINRPDLERYDLPAMLIAALLVFGPILLILAIIFILAL